jgi:hypothetical protein
MYNILLSEVMRLCKSFPHLSQMPSLTYNRENNIIIKNDIISNIKNTIFNLRDTDVVICINTSYIRIEGFNHYQDIIM